MTTNYPLLLAASNSVPRVPGKAPVVPPTAPAPGSWRYPAGSSQRGLIAIAVIVSAGIHAGVLFGFGPPRKKAAPLPVEEVAIIRLAIPDLKDLEEPEPAVIEETSQATDLATLVPMQADLPQLARPTDFVQPINFTSLLEKPDFTNMSIAVIPESFRGGRKLAENIGKIFSLSDLDRIPEPVLQTAPVYPHQMRRQDLDGRVQVEFVVDVEGVVRDAHVVATTNPGFDDAAVAAVSKWKFRPGIKSGAKVNTRMSVPLVFTLEDI